MKVSYTIQGGKGINVDLPEKNSGKSELGWEFSLNNIFLKSLIRIILFPIKTFPLLLEWKRAPLWQTGKTNQLHTFKQGGGVSHQLLVFVIICIMYYTSRNYLETKRFISLSRFSCSRPFHLFDLINLTCVCNVYTEYGEYLENINQTKYIYAISFIATTSRRKLI